MVSSNTALRWISYPTQVIAKSAKPIPVMVFGVFIGRKSYSPRKYLYVLMIVVGVTLFMYKSGRENENTENSTLGLVLILFSLFMNGITGLIQDRIRENVKPSGKQMMTSINAFSSLILSFLILITGEWREFFIFFSSHPESLKDLTNLNLFGALGQFFIFMMISEFGSLPCSIVSTVRKFLTVLFSVMVFGNSLRRQQWFGTTLVFVGLFGDLFNTNNIHNEANLSKRMKNK